MQHFFGINLAIDFSQYSNYSCIFKIKATQKQAFYQRFHCIVGNKEDVDASHVDRLSLGKAYQHGLNFLFLSRRNRHVKASECSVSPLL